MRRKTMAQDIQSAEFKDEFKKCPACGYSDGFHTMLKKEKEKIKWLFICPDCHKVFDIGCMVPVKIDPHIH